MSNEKLGTCDVPCQHKEFIWDGDINHPFQCEWCGCLFSKAQVETMRSIPPESGEPAQGEPREDKLRQERDDFGQAALTNRYEIERLEEALREIAALPLGDHRAKQMAEAALPAHPEGGEAPRRFLVMDDSAGAGEGMSAEQFWLDWASTEGQKLFPYAFPIAECRIKFAEAYAALKVREATQTIPTMFYADRKPTERVAQLVRVFQNATQANLDLEVELAKLREERDACFKLNATMSDNYRSAIDRYERAESALAEARERLAEIRTNREGVYAEQVANPSKIALYLQIEWELKNMVEPLEAALKGQRRDLRMAISDAACNPRILR